MNTAIGSQDPENAHGLNPVLSLEAEFFGLNKLGMDHFTSRVQELDFVDERNLGQEPGGFRMLDELGPVCRWTFGFGYFHGVYFQRGAVIYVCGGPGIDFTPYNGQPSRVSPLCID